MPRSRRAGRRWSGRDAGTPPRRSRRRAGRATGSGRPPARSPAGRAGRSLVGRPEGAALDDRVGLLARQPAVLDQGDQDPRRGVQAQPALDVLAHPLRPDDQPVDQAGHPDQHVVEQDRRVGQDDPLGRAVADVPLVPQRLVLERGQGVAAEQPGQPRDPLGQDRVALVGHRARALLAGPERLLELADLRVLEVADLGREPLQRAAGDRDRGQQRRMPVALDDLGADRVDPQPQRAEDLGLELGVEVAVGPDRPGDLAGGDLGDRLGQASAVAVQLERPAGQLEPERRRLGVDRVGPAHHHRRGLGSGAGDERRDQAVAVGQQALTGGSQLERQPGVDDIAAGQAEMEIAAFRADRLGDLADEGDDVVVGRPLDLGDPLDVDPGPALDRGKGLGRDGPRATCARATAISTLSIPSNRAVSDQIAPISGRV